MGDFSLGKVRKGCISFFFLGQWHIWARLLVNKELGERRRSPPWQKGSRDAKQWCCHLLKLIQAGK